MSLLTKAVVILNSYDFHTHNIVWVASFKENIITFLKLDDTNMSLNSISIDSGNCLLFIWHQAIISAMLTYSVTLDSKFMYRYHEMINGFFFQNYHHYFTFTVGCFSLAKQHLNSEMLPFWIICPYLILRWHKLRHRVEVYGCEGKNRYHHYQSCISKCFWMVISHSKHSSQLD